jgi:hypothetical protein
MRPGKLTIGSAILAAGCILGTLAVSQAQSQSGTGTPAKTILGGNVSAVKGFGTHFQTSDRCMACHNQLSTPEGEDISIGLAWRTSIMGNGARDPYWMAGVRRELTDHPTAATLINDECTICHMPMMRYESKLAGGEGGGPFAHLPPDPAKLADKLADDGISCTVCHQIQPDNLGTPESFVGGFKIDEKTVAGKRRVYGPYEIDTGHTTIMHSSSTFQPTEGKHIRSSELCATCHTLLTKALNPQGEVIGELPEQVPYQEWLHSDYKDKQSCQSCHMPVVQEEVPITKVFGEPRAGFSRHVFVGGNYFMQRLLGQHRGDLGVQALPSEMEAAAVRTIANLQTQAAKIEITDLGVRLGQVDAQISVENLGGHKLPTGYPSRRVWLHVTVRDRNGRAIFESGKFNSDGSITGNDNDADPTLFEPHYIEIRDPGQVQIYESVMGDPQNKPTTGLLTALRFLKDNRLLPRGFDKQTADKDVAVVGEALSDSDFGAGGDTVRYLVPAGDAQGPFRVEAELWYQPIAFRWAMNLKQYTSMEPTRFVGYYETAAAGSAVVLVRTTAATN